jgi:hypothetical protein
MGRAGHKRGLRLLDPTAPTGHGPWTPAALTPAVAPAPTPLQAQQEGRNGVVYIGGLLTRAHSVAQGARGRRQECERGRRVRGAAGGGCAGSGRGAQAVTGLRRRCGALRPGACCRHGGAMHVGAAGGCTSRSGRRGCARRSGGRGGCARGGGGRGDVHVVAAGEGGGLCRFRWQGVRGRRRHGARGRRQQGARGRRQQGGRGRQRGCAGGGRVCRRRKGVQAAEGCAGGGRVCRRRKGVQAAEGCAGGGRVCRLRKGVQAAEGCTWPAVGLCTRVPAGFTRGLAAL